MQWDYTDQYSTYTKVFWRIKDSTNAVVASGSTDRGDAITVTVSTPLSAIIPLKYTSSGNNLQGRFTAQLCMGSDPVPCDVQSDDRWSAATAVFAAGAPQMGMMPWDGGCTCLLSP